MAYREVHSFAAVGALGLCLAWASLSLART